MFRGKDADRLSVGQDLDKVAQSSMDNIHKL